MCPGVQLVGKGVGKCEYSCFARIIRVIIRALKIKLI